ncbi:MAG: LpxI family protein [Alphaproteobacteria bacterium]|nr:LpxI family protein [Alphaproteobacteria bacterium]
MSGLAIIAGRGNLPQMLAVECARIGRPHVVVRIAGMALDWVEDQTLIEAEFERFGALFDALKAVNCPSVVFAGGVDRPNLDMTRLDARTQAILPVLAAKMAGGDGGTLQAVADIFEAEGFVIEAAHEVLAGLLAVAGVLGAIAPTEADLADITRAAEITTALGVVDVGQGAVAAQGLCLGVESLQGTDAMLGFVARSQDLRPDPAGGRGVLFKGAKPGQDRRMDLPVIGPDTLENAAKAGLGGVAVRAGQVLILERDKTIAAANRLGLFLYGLPESTS